MPRATLLLTVCHPYSIRWGVAGERVEIRGNPGQHTQNAGALKGHELRLLLTRGA